MMANMSYCRFENTMRALQDCYSHLHDSLEGTEYDARTRLISICIDVLNECDNVEVMVTGDPQPVNEKDPTWDPEDCN